MKRKKDTIKSGFYKKYVDEIKQEKPQVKQEDKVIVINQNQKENLLTTIFQGIGSIFRVIIYIVLFALSSVGLTAIINEETRIILFEILNFS